jgi:UDP-N-acetylmuramyl pentapeptide synthase
VRAALDVLVHVAGEVSGRPVAVLGDMLELGAEAQRFHEEAGAYAAARGVEALWGVGPRSRSTVEGFRRYWEAEGGTAKEWTAGHVDSAEETSTVMDGLRRGDVALFKASRSMRLETLVRRVVEQAEAGRWASESDLPAGRTDATEETPRCSS